MFTPYTFFALLTLHVLGVVVWIGGSFFAFVALPAPSASENHLTLWQAGFRRFFPLVWCSVVVVFVSGEWLARGWLAGLDGPLYVHMMFAIGVLLMLLFAHLYFAPYRRLRQLAAIGDETGAVLQLRQIRMTLGMIGMAGLLVVFIAVSGPIWGGQPLKLAPYLPFLA